MPDLKKDLIRHTLATVAYRGGKTIRGAPADFADFKGVGKTPGELVAHLGDLFDWTLRMAQGDKSWSQSPKLTWDQASERFFTSLAALDAYLASEQPVHAPLEKLFQGPIADSLTHIGQLAMLRRLAGAPIRGENYYVASIETGRVGAEQAEPVQAFS
jgi:hypothetical protein